MNDRKQQQMEPLTLRLNATQRLVVSPYPERLIVEMHHVTNLGGHGWMMTEQVSLDAHDLLTLRDYLNAITAPERNGTAKAV